MHGSQNFTEFWSKCLADQLRPHLCHCFRSQWVGLARLRMLAEPVHCNCSNKHTHLDRSNLAFHSHRVQNGGITSNFDTSSAQEALHDCCWSPSGGCRYGLNKPQPASPHNLVVESWWSFLVDATYARHVFHQPARQPESS